MSTPPKTLAKNPVERVVEDVIAELYDAMCKYPPMNSAHEGYAILLEEVHELWECVRAKQGTHTKNGERDEDAMRKEAIQVAAMAVRFMVDVVDGGRGQR